MMPDSDNNDDYDYSSITPPQRQERPHLPTVAIVGRPNVGKSSLFNAIVGRRLAIVHEASGVTRDRLMAPASWNGRHFQVVDTGGIGTYIKQRKSTDVWDLVIRRQAEAAIEGADVLILVVNVQDGIVPLDREVADHLHSCSKKIILAVNKVDEPRHEDSVAEFSALGYDLVCSVSCLHRRGIGALLDLALEDLAAPVITESGRDPFRIAVVGRPNVGKSCLVNTLLGEDRVIVSDVAGTTRDSIDIDFELEFNGEKIPAQLVDTAGLRKKSRLTDAVEYFSVMRTQEAIKRSRLVLFLVEAKKEGVTSQDRHIASMIEESGKGCIIVANKWDICEEKNRKLVLDEIRYSLPGMTYAPVVFLSALQQQNIGGLLDHIAVVMGQLEANVPTSVVNKVIEDAMAKNAPQVVGLNPLKIYYGTMISQEPPTFLLFVNRKQNCADNYLAYLINFFRKAFGFTGLPVTVRLKERPKSVVSFHTQPDEKPGGRRVKPVNVGRPGGKKFGPPQKKTAVDDAEPKTAKPKKFVAGGKPKKTVAGAKSKMAKPKKTAAGTKKSSPRGKS